MIFTEILGIEFASSSLPEAVEYAFQLMKNRKAEYILAPDAQLVRQFQRDRRVRNAVNYAGMNLISVNGLVIAARILGQGVVDRINLIDFCSALFARMSEKEMSFFILGNDGETVENAAENITRRYPGLRLAGSDDGYYTDDDDIVDLINQAKPDLVLVCLDKDKQERWMYRNQQSINAGLMLAMGDSLAYYAGLVPRAPKRWRNSGFEWFYWLTKNPGRIFEMLGKSWVVFAALQRRIFGA